MTETELIAKLEAMGPLPDDETRNKIICALIGHSLIQSTFFSYFYCGRCGTQAGGSLGSVYSASKVVIVDHNCETCRANYARLDWQDKFGVADPFEEKVAP